MERVDMAYECIAYHPESHEVRLKVLYQSPIERILYESTDFRSVHEARSGLQRRLDAIRGSPVIERRRVRHACGGNETRLGEALAHLDELRSMVVMAAAALRQQNCELDADIARVLQRTVAGGIAEQMERLAIIAGSGLRERSAAARTRKWRNW
jgi:hypothetical protein